MTSFSIIIIMMFIAALLVGVAQKIRVPYPIALVIAGAAIGFIPGLPDINFNPRLLLAIVLPPILYYSAFGISFREFKKNWKSIFSLALGLVFVTTLVIGFLFKWLFPEFSWALAFAFGAIVAPPDAVATVAILKRLKINNRLLTLLEGESLINDASSLVLYKLAIIAVLSGTFSATEGVIDFFKVVIGGCLVGLALGYAIQHFSGKFLDPVVGVVLSFTIPYITYLAADFLGYSGVLAVVVNGLLGARVLVKHPSSLRRVIGFAAWDIFIIILNCFIFIIIGLQLRYITASMSAKEIVLYNIYALAIFLAMIVVRMLWAYGRSSLNYYLNESKKTVLKYREVVRNATIVGWAGMRGIVSLTAALAIPVHMLDGTSLEGRNEVIFITFIVILFSLLIPGFTLPSLICKLKLEKTSDAHIVADLRKKLAAAAENKLNSMYKANSIDRDEFEFLKTHFSSQHMLFEMTEDKDSSHRLELARKRVIQTQRKTLIEVWRRGEVDDKVIIHLENELDLNEIHIARADYF